FGEPQDAEPGRHRVPARAVRDHLQGERRARAGLLQVAELLELDGDPGDGPPEYGLVKDDPQLELALAEAALPFLAQHDEPLGLVDRVVAERDDGGRVLLRLQQTGD